MPKPSELKFSGDLLYMYLHCLSKADINKDFLPSTAERIEEFNNEIIMNEI